MRKHQDMHGPTEREQQMLALQDQGKTAREISEIMGLGVYYVEQRLHGLSMNDTAADKRFFQMVIDGSRRLGERVLAAGGHR